MCLYLILFSPVLLPLFLLLCISFSEKSFTCVFLSSFLSLILSLFLSCFSISFLVFYPVSFFFFFYLLFSFHLCFHKFDCKSVLYFSRLFFQSVSFFLSFSLCQLTRDESQQPYRLIQREQEVLSGDRASFRVCSRPRERRSLVFSLSSEKSLWTA